MDGKFVKHEGEYYVRVSYVISQFSDWIGGDKRADAARANKARIGTNVHKAIEEHVKYTMHFIPLEEDEKPYFNSFLQWEKLMRPVFSENEKRYFDKELLLTGAIDGIYKMPNKEELMIIDYKCTASPSVTWKMQAHLYYYMAAKENPDLSKVVHFLQLKKDSLPTAHVYKIEENTMNRCLAAVKDFWSHSSI